MLSGCCSLLGANANGSPPISKATENPKLSMWSQR